MSDKPFFPGQQPSSFDPMTGRPVYQPPPGHAAAPQQAPQQPWQQPQQPQYPQQQWQQPQQPQQQWGQQPQQVPQQAWGQQPQQPPQQAWGQPPQPGYPQQQQPQQQWGQQPQQPPQQAWGQQQGGQFPGIPSGPGFGGMGGGGGLSSSPMPMGDKDDDGESGGSLRENANATVGQSDRIRFIRLTYVHLMGAILAFALIEMALFKVPFLVEKVSIPLVKFALGIGSTAASARWHWAIVLGVFMVVSWLADYWARHSTSRPMQYLGLGLYVIAEALIFVPLLAIVEWKTAMIMAKGGGDPNIIRDAALCTLAIFGALTAFVLISKKDFSFLRGFLVMMSAAAMMLIVLSLIFGFNLGIVFAIAMVVLAAGYILFQTSQVLAHYNTNMYVAAALALFSSVALMFWYIIQIFMKARE